jgi:large subunit ribosomal protein L23
MDVLKRPIVTEKTSALNKMGQYAFSVDPRANKIQIKQAVEQLYGVSVKSVNTMRTLGKKRSKQINGRLVSGRAPLVKKAIVTVAEGEVIDIYGDL